MLPTTLRHATGFKTGGPQAALQDALCLDAIPTRAIDYGRYSTSCHSREPHTFAWRRPDDTQLSSPEEV